MASATDSGSTGVRYSSVKSRTVWPPRRARATDSVEVARAPWPRPRTRATRTTAAPGQAERTACSPASLVRP